MAGRRWFIVLAALALAVQVLVPQGFMVSVDRGQPTLVICTGHGPLTAFDPQHPGKPVKQTVDTPCAFAARGAVDAPPPPLVATVSTPIAWVERPFLPASSPAPGRGLAAPPPPSHGPPSDLI